MDKKRTCLECNMELTSTSKYFIKHIKIEHNLSYEDYILKHYYNNVVPTCNCGCGTKLQFCKICDGPWYPEYTTNHRKRGKKLSNSAKQNIKNGTIAATIKKYGVTSYFKTEEFKIKNKQTRLLKYENENYNNIEKNKQTKLEKYGNKNYHNWNKAKQTNLARYGVEYPMQCKEILLTRDLNNIKKYGFKNHMQNTEFKTKYLESRRIKTGYISNLLDPEFRKKYNNNTSKIEKIVSDKIGGKNKFILDNHEFDILVDNDIIEIDGNFYHPNKLENLSFTQINNLINDYTKEQIIKKHPEYNFYRIYTSILHNNIENITKEFIINNSNHSKNYDIAYNQVIIEKEYFQKYKELKSKDKLESYIPLLIKFIRTFQPNFPYPESKESIEYVIKYISTIPINSDKYWKNNHYSSIGNDYLKSKFKSYWQSSFKNNLSPYDAFYDNEILYRLLKYRIGINDSNEVFDFSLKQILKGLSALRYTISFFKPTIAASIYKTFLNTDTPTVLDPCAGFGGRLLGFKSMFPNGTYIGIEPRKETYSELLELSKNFSNVEIINSKIEDYNDKYNFDMVFTSIPFYNIEKYTEDNLYQSWTDWVAHFITSIKKYNNLFLIIPDIDQYINLFKTYKNKYIIEYNTSHFNKNNQIKKELILNI